VGVNAHVLHALARVDGYPDRERAIQRVCAYLADQHSGLYWIDKWHISPLYATAHVLRALEDLSPEQQKPLASLVARSRDWLRHSQNADGSWGFYGEATPEETAYGLLALATSADDRDMRHCDAAASYLHQTRDSATHPPLWIDKCLYIPPLVVNAAIDAALAAWARRTTETRSRTTP
jgi:hypothetical protein